MHLSQFSDDFARDLTAARAPFGRLMDLHEIKRVVQARPTCLRCGSFSIAVSHDVVLLGGGRDSMPCLRRTGRSAGSLPRHESHAAWTGCRCI